MALVGEGGARLLQRVAAEESVAEAEEAVAQAGKAQGVVGSHRAGAVLRGGGDLRYIARELRRFAEILEALADMEP